MKDNTIDDAKLCEVLYEVEEVLKYVIGEDDEDRREKLDRYAIEDAEANVEENK